MSTTTSNTTPAGARSGPVDPIGADLVRTLKELKLGQMTQTLPERLVLARQQKMTHAAFLQLVLADEITRRDSRSATLRARAAGLDPSMRLDTFDELDDLTYDRDLLAHLATLRFTEAGHGALVLGPVGVGKTHLASALGHIAIRRRMTVHAARADKLFTRLRASPRPPAGCRPPPPAQPTSSPACGPPGWTPPSSPTSATPPAPPPSSSTTSPSTRSTRPSPTTSTSSSSNGTADPPRSSPRT